MEISDFTNHVRQFYARLYTVTKRYGVLSRAIVRYFRPAKIQTVQGLTINTSQAPESFRATQSPVPQDLQLSQPSTTILGEITAEPSGSLPTMSSNVVSEPKFPQVSRSLRATLQKNSTWRTVSFLPASLQIDGSQGAILPFVSPVRTRVRSMSSVGTQNSQAKTSSPSLASKSTDLTNPAQPPDFAGPSKNPIQLSSTATRLLRIASALPIIPIALSRSSNLPTSSGTMQAQNPMATGVMGTQQNPTVAPSQSNPILSKIMLSLPNQATSILSSRMPFFPPQFRSIPLLGLNQSLIARTSPNLGRASQLTFSSLPMPVLTSQPVNTTAAPAGPSQNLSQIIATYANAEASQARLQLSGPNRSRTLPTTQLPAIQTQSRNSSFSTSASSFPTAVNVLPILGASASQTGSSALGQRETLPSLSDWEAQSLGQSELDDTFAMDELRSKISKILAEELRRHLPGE
jgi:hypothetical protein